MARISSGGACSGGLHHERQPAAQKEEQEEVEAAVVPPQRQGALHLHSPWGEGAQSLPHQPRNFHTLSLSLKGISSQPLPILFLLHGGPAKSSLTLTFPLLNLSSWAQYFTWLMKGFSVLSLFLLTSTHLIITLFFSKHEILVIQLTARLASFFTCVRMLHVFTLISSG